MTCLFDYAMTDSYVTWLMDTQSSSPPLPASTSAWRIDTWHDSWICAMTQWCVVWLIDTCHDSFICGVTHWYIPWLVSMWHVQWLIDMWHDSWIRSQARHRSQLAQVHDGLKIWHDSLIVQWLIHMWCDSLICTMTHWYVICAVTHWTSDMTLWLCHDSFTCGVTHWYVP